jgi:hypothetical protein
MPTISAEPEFRDNIRMELEGLPRKMNLTEQSEWEVVTSQHVWNYYAEFAAVSPELVPVHITSVKTEFKQQKELPNPSGSDRLLLEIEYSQTIEVGVHDKDLTDEEIEDLIFIVPYEYDTQSYLLALVEEWDLEERIFFIDIAIGEQPSPPTNPPTLKPEEDPNEALSTGVTATISVSIVLSAILIVSR